MRFKSGLHAVASFNWNITSQVERLEIVGTKGRILSSNLTTSGDLKLLSDRGREDYYLPPPDLSLTRVGLVENFVNSIITGKRNSVPGEEGLKTAKVVEAAYQSSKSGKTVTIP